MQSLGANKGKKLKVGPPEPARHLSGMLIAPLVVAEHPPLVHRTGGFSQIALITINHYLLTILIIA